MGLRVSVENIIHATASRKFLNLMLYYSDVYRGGQARNRGPLGALSLN